MYSEHGNALFKEVIKNEIDYKRKISWTCTVMKYLEEVNFKIADINKISTLDINKKIEEWDTIRWKEDVLGKFTLINYSRNKKQICEEKWFRNGREYEIMMRARSNTLLLNWREKDSIKKICPLCKMEEESIDHFIIECYILQPIRNECILLQHPRINSYQNDLIDKMLLFKKDKNFTHDFFVKLLYKLWLMREQIKNK